MSATDKRIWRTAKAKIIYTAIGFIALAGTLYIKGCFESEAVPPVSNSQTISSSPKIDSGVQNNSNFQVKQENADNSNVNNEFISGNKTVTNNNIIHKPKLDEVPKPEVKVEGKNVQMNYGGNNTQNNYEEKQRTLSDVDKRDLLFGFPSKECRITVSACNGRECIKYAQQIIEFLKEKGYDNVENNIGYTIFSSSGPKRDFYIIPDRNRSEEVCSYKIMVVPDTSD